MPLKIIDNTEIILFIIILLIYLILSFIFKLNTILGIQNIITFFAVLVALGTAILTLLNNKKILKQSEINLNTQLLHEDKKKSLLELFNILNDSTSDLFEISDFMESPNSLYLPNNTRNFIINVFKELEDYEKNAPWNHQFPTDEDLESEKNFNLTEWHNKLDTSREKLKEMIIGSLMNPN